MSALDPISLDSLSDDDAVTLLFDLTARGETPCEKLVQLDAMVYARFVQAYEADQLPVLRQLAA